MTKHNERNKTCTYLFWIWWVAEDLEGKRMDLFITARTKTFKSYSCYRIDLFTIAKSIYNLNITHICK